jgi:Cupin-like domain
MTAPIRTLREVDGRGLSSSAQFLAEVVEPCLPVVMRGLVEAWPAVNSATRSAEDFKEYLSRFDNGGDVDAFVGDPAIAGKYYYNRDLNGFNFERRRMRFADALAAIVASHGRAGAPTMYVGSVPINEFLPGFSAQNVLQVLPAHVASRIWLGHPANVSAHFDAFDNVACVVAGTRRFTLYPPEAIEGLYVGPLDNTMAGQPVSLAASAPPDDEKYPDFKSVRGLALSAELRPGDAIYIPKLWWHQIESMGSFNGLVNYWWDAFAAGPDAPYTGLLLSMIAIAERPAMERQAWKAFFDHYVFRTKGHPLAHLPAEQHGILGPLKPDNYAKLRAMVMHRLRGG